MDPMLQPSTASDDQNQLMAISKVTVDEIQMRYSNPFEDSLDEDYSEEEDLQHERGAFDLFDECDSNKYLSKFK